MSTKIDDEISEETETTKLSDSNSWIQLTEGKQYSRLLYTNPVCFLCTTTSAPRFAGANTAEAVVGTNYQDTKEGKTNIDPNQNRTASNGQYNQNVMVLSWLTATNNHGRFIFSLNRNRHSATYISQRANCEFTLCVPVQGMEDLVRNVGSTSGKWGSKFVSGTDEAGIAPAEADTEETEGMSKRQKRKKKRHQLVNGIPGLVVVPLGKSVSNRLEDQFAPVFSERVEDNLFAIQGTVAHLHCRVDSIVHDEEALIDNDHYLVSAHVVAAYCHPSYWDVKKNLFRPSTAQVRPYLTFFGAQTFGYVVPSVDEKIFSSRESVNN